MLIEILFDFVNIMEPIAKLAGIAIIGYCLIQLGLIGCNFTANRLFDKHPQNNNNHQQNNQ